MLDGIAAIHWTDPSMSKSFTRIFTQQEDNKIYEFCWDSDSLRWTRGNDGYSITSAARPNTNIVAFKAEANKIILGCIGQDGYLWLKKFNADDSGGGKIIYDFFFRLTSTEFRPENLASDPPDPKLASVSANTSLVSVDMSANGQLHWRLIYQADDNTIQQVDYHDNTWNTAITILTDAMPLTPLASVYSITLPDRTDLNPVLFVVYKDTSGVAQQVPWFDGRIGNINDWPLPWDLEGDKDVLGATVTGNAWPPQLILGKQEQGVFVLHMPEASGDIVMTKVSWGDGFMRWSGYHTGMPVGANKPLASVKIGVNIMIYTSSDSGKVFCPDVVLYVRGVFRAGRIQEKNPRPGATSFAVAASAPDASLGSSSLAGAPMATSARTVFASVSEKRRSWWGAAGNIKSGPINSTFSVTA
ncbi:hypothetical protein GGX14DRAFT_633627 [Mycena pura]|uniref:Fucose-specific lectin n=1 Tax=Mycena pura TaxID=153505 RepID=A0AAD6VC96_9AGAR|nr:hypothetical protein GGX14DRAFT_633627 [Mycena pura]